MISKSKFLSFMTKMNSNKGNRTKSEIFLLTAKYYNISMTFIRGIFQYHRKRENKVKTNK